MALTTERFGELMEIIPLILRCGEVVVKLGLPELAGVKSLTRLDRRCKAFNTQGQAYLLTSPHVRLAELGSIEISLQLLDQVI